MPAVPPRRGCETWMVAEQPRANAQRMGVSSRNRNDGVIPASSAARQLTRMGTSASVPADSGRPAAASPALRGGLVGWRMDVATLDAEARALPHVGGATRRVAQAVALAAALLAPTLAF